MTNALTIENLKLFHEYMKQPTVYGNIEISLKKYINEFKKKFEETKNDNIFYKIEHGLVETDNVYFFYNIYLGLVDSTYENASDEELKNIKDVISLCNECNVVILREKSIRYINTYPVVGTCSFYYCKKCAMHIRTCKYCKSYKCSKKMKRGFACKCRFKTFYERTLKTKVVRKNPALFFNELEQFKELDELHDIPYEAILENLLEQFVSLKNVNYLKDEDGNNELFLTIKNGNTEVLSQIAFKIDKENLLSKNNKNQDIYMYGLDLKLEIDRDYVNMLNIRRHLGLYQSTDINGKTTLMYDIQRGIGIVYILLFNTNQLNNIDNKGNSALMYAINNGNIETFDEEPDELKNWLKNQNSVVDEKVNNELIEYCHTEWNMSLGNNHYIYILIKLGINMQTINIKGITPLMRAHKQKKYDVVNFFLDNCYKVQTLKDYSIVNRVDKKYRESMKPFEKKLLDIFNNILPTNLILCILQKI